MNQVLNTNVSLYISISYIWAKDLERNEPMPEIAPMYIRYQVKSAHFSNKLTSFLQLRYVLEQNRVSTEFGEAESPAFLLIDTNFRYKLPLNAVVTLSINNVLNTNYAEHLNRINQVTATPIFSPGRNISNYLSTSF